MTGEVSTSRFAVRLVSREWLSPRVHRLHFAAQVPFQWAAGQYLVVVRGAGRALALPYSIASACDPTRPGEFDIAAAFQAGADVMDALAPGAELEVEGPAGDFIWQAEPSSSALLVGVGTGIAPLRALILEQLACATATRLLLLAGHRLPEEVLFHADFERLAAAHPRFQFVPTVTGEAALWLGRRGRVQTQLTELVAQHATLDAYVCGRLDMVSDVVSRLLALGLPESRIRSEGY